MARMSDWRPTSASLLTFALINRYLGAAPRCSTLYVRHMAAYVAVCRVEGVPVGSAMSLPLCCRLGACAHRDWLGAG